MQTKRINVALMVLALGAFALLSPSRVEAAEISAMTYADANREPRPLAETLDELGRFYGVFFTYDALLVADTEVDFEPVATESLEEAVTRLLEQTNLGYESFDDKYIVLYKDSKRGRREAGRLRRKVRQLSKLEQDGRYAGLIRSDRSKRGALQDLETEQTRIAKANTSTGFVTDEDGEPLIGVSIRIVGTAIGTTTDEKGRFSLQLPDAAREADFTYLGHLPVRKVLKPGKRISIQLQQNETELPQVLVVGYGTVDPAAVTSSIVQVGPGEMATDQSVSMPHQWLRGRVAGVQVLAGNGEQSAFQSIRIRGGTSMNASNEPLYVIDGMPVDNAPHVPSGLQPGRNPLNSLNPSDIASVTVLKDAAAGAIYGSRAANGVVLIETKRPQLFRKGELRYDGWVSVATPAAQLEVFDADAYRELVGRLAPWRLPELGDASTDWQETILQPAALTHQHTVSYQAGGEQSAYRISLGYLGRESIVNSAGTERLSATLNARKDFWKRQLTLTTDVKLARISDTYISPTVFTYAYAFDPTQPVTDAESRWGGYFEYDNDLTIKNPLGEAEQVKDEGRTTRLLGNLKAVFAPTSIPGLRATLLVGTDLGWGRRNLYAPATVRYQFANQGEYRLAQEQRRSRLWESYLNYDRRIAEESIGLALTVGYTYQHGLADFPEEVYLGIEGYDYAFGQAPVSDRQSNNFRFQENRLASFFGRASVDLNKRYFLTASLRTDGSSRFNPNDRWATFPAASFAWLLSDEGILRSRPQWIGRVKLRAGWGLTGNQEIGDYQYLPTFTLGDDQVRFPFGDELLITARPNAVSNNLKWEQTSSFNIALETDFFNNRLRMTVEAYRSTTKDLLSRVIVPAGSNFSDVVLTNVGSIRNQGFEFSADLALIEKPGFTWTLGLNFATNKNEVLSLGPGPDQNFRAISTGNISGGTGNTIQIYREGEPLHAFYVFAHKRDLNGRPLVDGLDHNGDGRVDLADMYEDVNGDGEVNDGDKRPYGQPAPRLFGGLQSSIRYQNWGFHASLRGQMGNHVYNNLAAFSESYNNILIQPELLNVPTSIRESGFQSPQFFSDYYVEDASFLRLDAVTLEHTFQRKDKGLQSLRAYVSLQNIFTLTSYRGLDPEVGNASGNPADPRYGIDDRVFPRSRSFLVGVNAIF